MDEEEEVTREREEGCQGLLDGQAELILLLLLLLRLVTYSCIIGVEGLDGLCEGLLDMTTVDKGGGCPGRDGSVDSTRDDVLVLKDEARAAIDR